MPDIKRVLAAAVLCLTGTGSALALPCSGFTDVDDTSPFCAAVAWMKNRGVTTGCTPTTYCPEPTVTRAQTALFMSRLERALPPALQDSNGLVVGVRSYDWLNSVSVLVYRTGGEAFVIALEYLEQERRFYYASARMYFQGAGCTGQAETTGWAEYSNIGGKRLAELVHGSNGQRSLYATSRYPVTLDDYPYASYMEAGACVTATGTVFGALAYFVEDLALKYTEPLEVR